jgi:predicted phosphodiesterase
MVLNPGSATLPKEKSHHGYMTWENGVFIWKDFDGHTIDTLTIK